MTIILRDSTVTPAFWFNLQLDMGMHREYIYIKEFEEGTDQHHPDWEWARRSSEFMKHDLKEYLLSFDPACRMQCYEGRRLSGSLREKGETSCGKHSRGTEGYVCTRDRDHDGPHVACGGEFHDLFVWDENNDITGDSSES